MISGESAVHLEQYTVTLPGGLVLDDERLESAGIVALTGHQEDWLARNRGVSAAEAVTEILTACVIRLGDRPASRELIRRMLVGDRDYLMMHLRKITFGDEVYAVATCPACGARIDVALRVADIPVTRRPQPSAVYEIPHARPNGDGPIVFRLPVGADQEAIAALDPAAGAEALIERCLVSSPDESLDPDDRQALAAAMEGLAPRVDVELDITCSDCEAPFVDTFDLPTFFLSELRSWSDQLLREVHSFAFYYHWSEHDILAMDRPRRRAYLRLLNEALHQE